MTATSIPIMPCIDLSESLAFYALLGFEKTYEQARPNPYAVMARDGAQLHFAAVPGLKPENVYTTCLVIVPEVEALHATFAAALRNEYGKVPVTGRPRLSRMKPGQSRFTVVDPAGSSVIFIRQNEPEGYTEDSTFRPKSHLGKAFLAATRLRDYKGDDEGAAKLLDVALGRKEPGVPVERARVLAARLELAVVRGEEERARALELELKHIPLTATERAQYRHELGAADKTRELKRRTGIEG